MKYLVYKNGKVTDDDGNDTNLTEQHFLENIDNWVFARLTHPNAKYTVIDRKDFVLELSYIYLFEFRSPNCHTRGTLLKSDILKSFPQKPIITDDNKICDVIDNWYLEDVHPITLRDRLNYQYTVEDVKRILNYMNDGQKILYLMNNGRFSNYLTE